MRSDFDPQLNLARKLSFVHKGVANASLPDIYDEKGLPIIDQMLNRRRSC